MLTAQEKFWQGEFGTEYIARNRDEKLLRANEAFFGRVFRHMAKIESVLEFGANIGMNLRAIRRLVPECTLSGIEINKTAVAVLAALGSVEVFHQSIFDFEPREEWDFVLSKTVLIHIPPDHLPTVYDKLVRSSTRYICLAEYYSPVPTEVEYRGHSGKLFKRDFAGELLERYPDLELLDYGFLYHRDPYFPQDDINWFLLEKRRG